MRLQDGEIVNTLDRILYYISLIITFLCIALAVFSFVQKKKYSENVQNQIKYRLNYIFDQLSIIENCNLVFKDIKSFPHQKEISLNNVFDLAEINVIYKSGVKLKDKYLSRGTHKVSNITLERSITSRSKALLFIRYKYLIGQKIQDENYLIEVPMRFDSSDNFIGCMK